MLTGRLPFTAQNSIELSMQHISMQPPPPRQFRPDLSPALEAVILKLLAKDPAQRYPDGQALLADFEAAVQVMPKGSEAVVANRVARVMEDHPLPPLRDEAAAFNANSTAPTQPKFNYPLPILMLAGAAIMLLLAGCLAFALINLSDDAEEITETDDTDDRLVVDEPAEQSQEASPTSGSVLSVEDYVLLQSGVGLTNGEAMNEGNFQVEGYCQRQGYSSVSNNGVDWYCNRRGTEPYPLTQTDYDLICQLTYSNENAIAMNVDGLSPTFAFNWRCYAP